MRIAFALIVVAGCHAAKKPADKVFGESCGSDSECLSARCLPSAGASSFCTQSCTDDVDCGSAYCCERSGKAALCTVPPDGACRQPVLGDICSGVGDPFCARAGLMCATVDGLRDICTRACASSADCSAVPDAECATISGTALCVPPDPDTIRVSDCGGDSDCPSGQICQFFDNNDTNPTGLVTQCTDLKRGTVAAYKSCTNAEGECDRDFCEHGFCPATCTNDSYCQPDFICTPLSILVRQDDPSTFANEQIKARLGLCTPRPGSLTPCDVQTPTSCAAGEACGYLKHFDGTLSAVCQTGSGVAAGDTCTANACATTLQIGIDACFTQRAAPSYCVSPCLTSADCPNAAMSCIYDPFEPLCEVSEFNPAGGADGTACAATSGEAADAQCASNHCDDTRGTCAPRAVAGTACTRQDECESLICLNSVCQQLCRDDGECPGGLCGATPFRIDVDDTPENAADDRFDLPTMCQAQAVRTSCHSDSDCATAGCGTVGCVCRTVFNRDGSLDTACTAPPNGGGLSLGASCVRQTSCDSGLCLGASGAAVCSAACRDDNDCLASMRCTPATLFGTAVDTLCLSTDKTLAPDGAACTTFGDCQSNLCAEGVCVPMCPHAAKAGDVFGAPADGKICVPVPVSVDARFTSETSDDRVGYVLAPIATSTCTAGPHCVYRPTDTTHLVGYVLTPNPDARADGAPCQLAVNCQSGLCVSGVCAAPCQNTCTTGSCNASARALTLEGTGATAVVPACVDP